MIAKWVICLDCGERYYLEKYTKKSNDCCPICSSREYDDDEDVELEDIDIEEY